MRKSKNPFKKTGDFKGIFHARMGMVKDRNSMEVADTEDIKKRWPEYMEE